MRDIPDVHRIAVLRANALGDFIVALPALESLRAAYPNAELVLMGAPWHEETLRDRPGPVDRVVVVPACAGIREPVPADPMPADQLPAFLQTARAERFDVALQMHGGGGNSNPIVSSLGARVTAGLQAAHAPPLDRNLPYDFYQPEVFRYLEVAELVGAPAVTYRPRFALCDADRQEAARVAPPGRAGRVVLHPGANDPRRRWPAEHFASLARVLVQQGMDVVVTGTSGERELVGQVCGAAGPDVRPLVGRLTLGGLAALLARATVVVSNDTGALHLAAAVDTPVVGLFWVGNVITFAQPDRRAYRPLISWRIHCPRCGADSTKELYPSRGAESGCTHRDSFLADIPVAEVVGEVEQLIRTAAA
ncbi:MAG TPA: glycosyltransferase family 9 protein [Micromonosporaceae bacterium]|jgi:ADP-heptose:LPS heptosyltransferase